MARSQCLLTRVGHDSRDQKGAAPALAAGLGCQGSCARALGSREGLG